MSSEGVKVSLIDRAADLLLREKVAALERELASLKGGMESKPVEEPKVTEPTPTPPAEPMAFTAMLRQHMEQSRRKSGESKWEWTRRLFALRQEAHLQAQLSNKVTQQEEDKTERQWGWTEAMKRVGRL